VDKHHGGALFFDKKYTVKTHKIKNSQTNNNSTTNQRIQVMTTNQRKIYTLYRRISDTSELGFYFETERRLTQRQLSVLHWLVAETYERRFTNQRSWLSNKNLVEIGGRLSIESPFSSNGVSNCQSIGLPHITRIEFTRRRILAPGERVSDFLRDNLDPLTEQHYPNGISTFETGIQPAPVRIVDLIGGGAAILEKENKALGLGMDADDIAFYYDLFVEKLRRNPTDVELVQLGNANSEHSRHWFFRGKIVIDGKEKPRTLFDMVRAPLLALGDVGSETNRSLVAFHDNAGVLRGFETDLLLPYHPGRPSMMRIVRALVHMTATAETHNHPTLISPYEGATTGTGGEIRDSSAVGLGGITGIGASGYFVGSLWIPGYEIPGEVSGHDKPSDDASPLRILLRGSSGALDYGNQFGRPTTLGWCRAFEQLVGGELRAARKPILYSGGIGHLLGGHEYKRKVLKGMRIVRIGGPAYPIGLGGGSASSVQPGESTKKLDLASVQRGNAEMEQRATRVIRACVEMQGRNPIASIHDQGAGGPANVLTELVEPLGGIIDIRKIRVGDKTMSFLQIWCSEFQEGFGFLIAQKDIRRFRQLCQRERVNCEVVGRIDGSGSIVVKDSLTKTTPVSLNLNQVLTGLPQKTFRMTRKKIELPEFVMPDMPLGDAIKAVFKQLSVGSKGFLMHKVDRSVTGLVAQQQTCGIAQIPISDVSILAQSYFGLTGTAGAIGENPNRMLICPKAGARMALAEMLTNLASAHITDISDIRCRLNWMWPAKMEGEGPLLYDAVEAITTLMREIGIAADGGKDSLSMAANASGEKVKTPGSAVVFGYAPIKDITMKVTPDIKRPGASLLGLIDLGGKQNRLGGSALAQATDQLGNKSPDVDDPKQFKNAILALQQMIKEGLILAMHDRSDGGLIATVAEMCMAARCGFDIRIEGDVFPALFAEELGWVIEYDMAQAGRIREVCRTFHVPFEMLGETIDDVSCTVHYEKDQFDCTIHELRRCWENTSFELEKLQINPVCAKEEYAGHTHTLLPANGTHPSYKLTFMPTRTASSILNRTGKPRVAVIREEGTNGDREMLAALTAAGFAAYDVTMSDLLAGRSKLDTFRGIVFAGGFSYKDTFGSAKGWAATILFNPMLKKMFDRFYTREDTFSLGVCNGCQLMALLGWVPWKGIVCDLQPRFVHNVSGRFESRWVQAIVQESPSILFTGMIGSRLGVWIAHGEGKLVYPNKWIADKVKELHLESLAFVDPFGNVTETYPFNANGSPGGATALCDRTGRHNAMMPHPERSFQQWQVPWMPEEWRGNSATPWMRMFQNAYEWCMAHGKKKRKVQRLVAAA
jgi:phosphoribosylformylglycinamidine synthase